MPIWYDPATRQPYILENGSAGFKRLVGANNFTISFHRKIPVGFGKTTIKGSRWWYPQQQILFVLERIEDTHLVGTVYQGGFTLRMPISKATFLLEYRYVPPLKGTYWTLSPTGELIEVGEMANETLYITAVKSLTVYYRVPKARHVTNQYVLQRHPQLRRPTLNLLDLLRRGYQRELPAPGDIWVDLHGEDIEVTRANDLEVSYRNLVGGTGWCLTHEFFYLFHRPAMSEAAEPEQAPEPEPPTVWDRIS